MRRSKQWLALLLAVTLVASNAVYSLSTSLYANEAGAVEEMAMDGASQDGAPGGLGSASGEGTASVNVDDAMPVEGDGGVMVEEVEDVTPAETTTTPDPTVEETTQADVNGAAGENPDQNPLVEENVNQEEIYGVAFNWDGSQGSVSGFGDGTVKKGGYLSFTVTAYEGFAIGSVTATDGNLSADFGDENSTQYTLGNINSNTTVNVSFYAKPVEAPVETPAVEENKADAPGIEETKPEEAVKPEVPEKIETPVEKEEAKSKAEETESSDVNETEGEPKNTEKENISEDGEEDKPALMKSAKKGKANEKDKLVIKIRGKSESKVYDGTPLSTNSAQVDTTQCILNGENKDLSSLGIHVSPKDSSRRMEITDVGRIDTKWTEDDFDINFTDSDRKKYDVEVDIEQLYLEVTPREILVKAKDISKKYGEQDPELKYEVGKAVNGETAKVKGKLSREGGEQVGTYPIGQGNLELEENDKFKPKNYELKFEAGKFTIEEKDSLQLNVKSYTGTYDGEYHTVEYQVSSAGGEKLDSEKVKYKFSTDGEKWSDQIIEYKDVVEGKSVYVKATVEGYKPVTEKGTVTITKGKVQVEIIGKNETVVYDGKPHTAKDVAHLCLYSDGKEITGSIGVVLKNGEELVTVTGIDAGTYPQPSIDTSKFQIESIEGDRKSVV